MIERKLKFCTTCQSSQPEQGGFKKPGSTRAWRCANCLAHKSVSIYAAIKKTGKS